MAHGIVAGFIKHEGSWYGEWVSVEHHREPRLEAVQGAIGELRERLGLKIAGPAVAGYKMVVIDGLCPDGREFIEDLFETTTKQDTNEDEGHDTYRLG